jgi:transcription elongation factor GreB
MTPLEKDETGSMAGTRYRPPAAPSSAYITRAGFERLRAELNELWRQRRPEVVSALSAAAAEGDRSENAEYQYRKKQLGEIDRRLRYLTRRLERLKVVEEAPTDRGRIYVGAWVELEDEAGACRRYRLVGPDEIDAGQGWISIDAPLARALLGKRAEEEVEVHLPAGPMCYFISSVSYQSE